MMQLEDVLLLPVPPDHMFDAEQLAIGQQVELEHTEDMEAAKIIAKHHLLEDRDYYRKLRGMHLDGPLPGPIYSAPRIQVLNGVWGDAAWPEKLGWAVSGIGVVTAVGGLIAKKPVLAKVAGGLGVIGGLSSLIFAIIRGNNARDMIEKEFPEAADGQVERSMIDVLVGGVAMTANAVALLLVPARSR